MAKKLNLIPKKVVLNRVNPYVNLSLNSCISRLQFSFKPEIETSITAAAQSITESFQVTATKLRAFSELARLDLKIMNQRAESRSRLDQVKYLIQNLTPEERKLLREDLKDLL